jgi:hypothetical protein
MKISLYKPHGCSLRQNQAGISFSRVGCGSVYTR